MGPGGRQKPSVIFVLAAGCRGVCASFGLQSVLKIHLCHDLVCHYPSLHFHMVRIRSFSQIPYCNTVRLF